MTEVKTGTSGNFISCTCEYKRTDCPGEGKGVGCVWCDCGDMKDNAASPRDLPMAEKAARRAKCGICEMEDLL